MKAWIAWAVLGLALLAIPVWIFGFQPAASAKRAAAAQLRDPDSAQFRNVRQRDLDLVCGEINGKNAYGGYAGYRRFIVDHGRATIEPGRADIDRSTVEAIQESIRQVRQETAFLSAWNANCG